MFPDCVLTNWPRNRQGYGLKTGRSAHREAWETNRGPIPDGMLVCHKCDNPPCVNVEHLFLGTHSDNVNDAVAKGRWTQTKGQKARGEAHPRARLTDSQVIEVRDAYRSGRSQRDIASAFGVSRSCIAHIVRGNSR